MDFWLRTFADFVADRPAVFARAFYVQGTPAAEGADFAVTGVFGQARWEISPRLTLTGGLRFDLGRLEHPAAVERPGCLDVWRAQRRHRGRHADRLAPVRFQLVGG